MLPKRLLLLAVPVLLASALHGQAASDTAVYFPGDVDQMPRRVSGPTLDYPRGALKADGERVLVEVVFDTMGRVEPASFRIVQSPDSALNASVRATLLATVYSPAIREGRRVRLLAQVWLVLHSPGAAINATALISQARGLAAEQHDSALALLHQAFDTSAHMTDGERVYALLVKGVVEIRAGRTELGALDEKRGIDLWQLERARGIELAPFLNDLADSVRLARAGARAVGGSGLVVIGSADVAPAILSRPPVAYPPEARALGVVGTVVVEADIDTSGTVVPGSLRVVESPNPLLDSAAVRIVRASRYRPARSNGRAVRVRVRQPITLRP